MVGGQSPSPGPDLPSPSNKSSGQVAQDDAYSVLSAAGSAGFGGGGPAAAPPRVPRPSARPPTS